MPRHSRSRDVAALDVDVAFYDGDPGGGGTLIDVTTRGGPLVGGDEAVGYGHIYGAMVLLQKAGVSKVGLMSDPLDSLEGQDGG